MSKAYGIAITALGVLVVSPDSTLIRLIAQDSATTLFWRGVALALGSTALLACRGRAQLSRGAATLVRPAGIILTLAFVVINATLVWSVKNTAIAATLGSLATTAVFAAIFSALFLRERQPRHVWLAVCGSAAGLALITAFGSGALFGRAVGVACAAAFGAAFVAMRFPAGAEPLPALAASGGILAILSAVPAEFGPIGLGPTLAVVGIGVVMPVSIALVGIGSRIIGASEVGLLMLLETVFGTLWARLFLGESPGPITLAAVALILATLTAFYAYEMRLARRATRSVSA